MMIPFIENKKMEVQVSESINAILLYLLLWHRVGTSDNRKVASNQAYKMGWI